MILGFDPGQKGGCAVLKNNGEIKAIPMPLAGKELDIQSIASWIKDVQFDNSISLAVCEKARGMPGQGITSTCTFCRGYGILLGILGALAIPTILVTPQAWKKTILAGTKKDKDAAIAYVRMKYPTVELVPKGCRKPHDGMADSICIAEYGELKRI